MSKVKDIIKKGHSRSTVFKGSDTLFKSDFLVTDFREEDKICKFKFIDLFAGIGGFHIAGEELGGVCVFASEWDEKAREVYLENFYKNNKRLFDLGNFAGDITLVDEKKIPKFDFLFAGFPCQPFSKGGHRKGFEDTRGTLFFDIARILDYHKPKYVLLENVSNLLSHDDGRTFNTITRTLKDIGYVLNSKPIILSPDKFGIPAIRARLYIPAIRKDLVDVENFTLDFSGDFKDCDGIDAIVDKTKKDNKYYISEYERRVIDMWNEFYKNIDLRVIGFPIWASYFNTTDRINHLPIWKQGFIIKNRELYLRNKKFINTWLLKYDNLSWVVETHRKLEWQAGSEIDDIYDGLIQFRPSGVRVKRANKFSTLVAMNHSQIVGKYKRRITPDETKILQSLPKDFRVHPDDNVALRQLGNAVNVQVVKIILEKMLNNNYEKSRTGK